MKLNGKNVPLAEGRVERDPVVDGGSHSRLIVRHTMERVNEVHPSVFTQPGEHRIGRKPYVKPIPLHLGDFETVGRRDPLDRAGNYSQSSDANILLRAGEQHLHADADPEEGAPFVFDGFDHRVVSLVVDAGSLPPGLLVTARDDEGTVMAIADERQALYGVQFHPESILTNPRHGLRMLANALRSVTHAKMVTIFAAGTDFSVSADEVVEHLRASGRDLLIQLLKQNDA